MLWTASDVSGFFFFWPVLTFWTEGIFHKWFLPIVLQIMPPPKNNPNPQVLWTASDGWCLFFFDLFSHSGLRAFFTIEFTNCTTDYAPSIRCCSQHLMVGGFFFTCSPILDLGHFSQKILPIVLQIMPPPKITPLIRCYSQHLKVMVFFWPVLPFWTQGIFHKWFFQLYYKLCPAQK